MIQFSSRVLVRLEEEDPGHVEEHQDDEDARPHLCMPRTSQPERDGVPDVLDRLVGGVGIRLVVEREHDPRDRLDDEGSAWRSRACGTSSCPGGTLRKRKYLVPPTSPERLEPVELVQGGRLQRRVTA